MPKRSEPPDASPSDPPPSDTSDLDASYPDGSYRPPPIDVPASRGPLVWRAVFLGVLVDWLGTVASSTVVLFMAALVAAGRYQSEGQVEAYLEKLFQAPDFAILMAVIGLACVAVGGFAAGVVARREEWRHALAMGVISLAIGLVIDGSTAPGEMGWSPAWLRVVGHLLVVPAALLGGAAAAARNAEPGRDAA